jgi:hypothetical protein
VVIYSLHGIAASEGNFVGVRFIIRGRDSAVGKATRYEQDGPGIESQWGEIFRTCPDQPWGPRNLLYSSTGSFPGVKRPGRAVDHPPPSSAEVKKSVELYLYSPSGSSWPVVG